MSARRGRRFTAAAGVALVLAAVAHTLGHLPLLTGAERSGSIVAMDADRAPLGLGMAPSMLDIHLALVLTLSVTYVALGAITLLIALGEADARLHRRVAWLDTISIGVLVAVYAYYRVPPPLVSTVVVEALLVVALIRSRRTGAWPMPAAA